MCASGCGGCAGWHVDVVAGEELLVEGSSSVTFRWGRKRRGHEETGMGRFHQHADRVLHTHDHGDAPQHHEHDGPPRDVGDHTGYETGPERVTVLTRILDENDRVAEANRRA